MAAFFLAAWQDFPARFLYSTANNIKSIDLVLSASDIEEINSKMEKIEVKGARLDDGLLSMSE